MVTFDHMSRLIDRIYETAETGSPWDDCLRTICRDLKATGSNLVSFSPTGTTVGVIHAGWDQSAVAAYVAYFHRIAPWKSRMPVPSLRIGDVVPGYAVISHAEVQKTEFYADFGRSANVSRALHAVVIEDVDGSRVGLSNNRGDRDHEFDRADAAYISALVPHFGRALQARSRLGAAAQRGAAAFDAMDRLPLGVLLVDGNARICHANTRGADVLRQRDGIATDGRRRLLGATSDATVRLRDLCGEIAKTRFTLPRHPGAALSFPRAGGKPPLQVLVAPIQTQGGFATVATDAVAVLYLNDPTETYKADEEVLRVAYGLTEAESRVAALLGSGQDAKQVADQLGYTLQTARWYVKQVLAKSESRSRAEFVARVAYSIATLPRR
jgi:DNA-binding CsgD family transcriptional regulator